MCNPSIGGVKMKMKPIKLNKEWEIVLNDISDDYALDFELFDKETYTPVHSAKKTSSRKGALRLIDFLRNK